MKIQYTPEFYKLYKKADVRIRNAFDNQIRIFKNQPTHTSLNNHELKEKWSGYRSIDITADWRAIYKEVKHGKDAIAYFVAIGIHKKLYSSN